MSGFFVRIVIVEVLELKRLLSEEVRQYIRQNEACDIAALLLSGKSVNGVPASTLADQIVSRRKAKIKLPHWFAQDKVIYPPPLSLEQASSAATGQYKASLCSGTNMIDITGGMGIDASFFADSFEALTYVEMQTDLVAVFTHNAKMLGLNYIKVINSDGIEYLKSCQDDAFDLIYTDPARRDPEANKVFAIHDCTPDIVSMQSLLLSKGRKVMIKLSPMLDISHSLELLNHVEEVHVVAVNNECKELLFLLSRDFIGKPIIKTINIEKSTNQYFDFYRQAESEAMVTHGFINGFLYEPNAAVLKAGAYKLPADRFELSKLDIHTHLYTSDQQVENFPGKVYRILSAFGSQKKEITKRLKGKKISIKTRNYPMTVAAIRNKYGFPDGDEAYVFFCQIAGKKMVLECVKI
ncbi:MAG: class I SAM-dependent methyltransferase [Cyclobacteriaceae bacterium]